MPVYFIAQVDIRDRAGYERYAQAAGAAALPPGTKPLAMDDAPRVLEGKWAGRTIILEFASEEAFRSWYDSPAYQAAAKIRQASTTSNVILVKSLGA
jgi:uncharacterized protein (DUF1330 family)